MKLVDATGAGDCFCGNLLARLARGDTLFDAARYANAAAAFAVQGFGAVAPLAMPRAGPGTCRESRKLVAVDWGTSSLRAALLMTDGRAIEERSLPRGILTVPPGEFPAVLDAACGDWMTRRAGRWP